MQIKRQKRYYSEKSIIDQIDKIQAQKLSEMQCAEELDKFATEGFKWCGQRDEFKLKGDKLEEWRERYSQANDARTEAARLRKHQSAFEPKLERLKRTLTAFQTEPFAFCEKAVVAQ